MATPSKFKSAFRLDGRSALITGGGSGIGRATAISMAMAGADVCVVDRNEDAAKDVAAEIREIGGARSCKVLALCADVTDEEQVENAVAAVAEEFGKLNILVNSAGVAIREPSVELSIEKWQKVIDVNMTGTFLCSRHAAKNMLESGEAGSIINVASINGLTGSGIYPNISYQTSKGAVVNMTRALAVEWASAKIRVNAVAPTWVDTPFIAGITANQETVEKIKQLTPLGRLAQPDDVANAILYLASPAAAMVTGHILVVDGGFLA